MAGSNSKEYNKGMPLDGSTTVLPKNIKIKMGKGQKSHS